MNKLLLNFLLAIAWMFLNGNLKFTAFIDGFLIGFILIALTSYATNSKSYVTKIPKLISFILYFIYELVKANIIVAIDIVTPESRLKSAIVAVPLTATTDAEITILANLITLTPGTLSLDVSSDRKVIYVHSLYTADPQKFINEIKNGMEKKLLEVMR